MRSREPALDRGPARDRVHDRRRTAELRAAWRSRTARRSTADVAYAGYLAAVTGLLLVVPAVVVVLDALRTPAVLAALEPATAPRTATLAIGLAWSTALVVGGTYGPVTIDPVLVGLWGCTDLPRRIGLRPHFLHRAAWLTTAGAAAGALAGAVPGAAGSTLLRLALAGAAVGLVTSIAWLAGQAAARHSWWLGLGLLGLTLLATDWPPARWLGLAALAAPLAVPHLLDTLRGPDLLAMALRWQSAATTARSGDVQSALGSLRALPRRGRRWRAITPGPAPVRYGTADLVGAARTTGRTVTGWLTLTLGALLAGLATEPSSATLLAAGGALLAYLGLGVFCDGLREAAALAAQPALYGHGTWQLFALRGVAPAVASLAAGAVAGGLAALTGTAVHGTTILLVLVAVLTVRAWGAAKGPLPVALLAPVPTPLGDLSGINVTVWLADAPLLALLAGGGPGWLLTTGRAQDAVVGVAALVGALLLGLRRRLERL